MAHNEIVIGASPEEVWAVFADASLYPRWVVGAKEFRGADGRWPEPGSVFHHSVGAGPFKLEDNTKCLAVDPNRSIEIEARARPLGRAVVKLSISASEQGTLVGMDEVVCTPRLLALFQPLLDPPTRLRNAESLRRLSELVMSRARP